MEQRKKPELEEKDEFVYSVFQDIAPNYDRMNSILSFGRHKSWRQFAMKKIRLLTGQKALDVCCGTCDWTISLAKEVKENGYVYGLDFSPKMLEVGQRKIEQAGLGGQVTLVEGNAMRLPFEDNVFDVATVGFALRNVPDWKAALQEMQRVVKPGGQVVSLELSHPSSPAFRWIYLFYFQRILPLLGKWLAGQYQQYRWLPQSLEDFPDAPTLQRSMEEMGFARVSCHLLNGGIAALHIGVKKEDERNADADGRQTDL